MSILVASTQSPLRPSRSSRFQNLNVELVVEERWALRRVRWEAFGLVKNPRGAVSEILASSEHPGWGRSCSFWLEECQRQPGEEETEGV